MYDAQDSQESTRTGLDTLKWTRSQGDDETPLSSGGQGVLGVVLW
jgi:hypothetical protein